MTTPDPDPAVEPEAKGKAPKTVKLTGPKGTKVTVPGKPALVAALKARGFK